MFTKACSQIRNATYGVVGTSQVAKNRVNYSNGTAFMIAPGVLATAAHLTHVENNPKKPNHTLFQVIRAPEVGKKLEKAELVAEDVIRDIALLRIEKPRSNACVTLEPNTVPTGTSCGSFGFPLAWVEFKQKGKTFQLIARFQGANISAFHTQRDPLGRTLAYYETDALMYKGSSGCPGFLVNGNVFGMHNKSVIEKPKKKASGNRKKKAGGGIRLAISIWVPSVDIISFAKDNGTAL